MAVTAEYYGKALQSMLNAEIDMDTDTIKLMLTTASYVPDKDAHRYKSSVTNEVSGTGYTAGGATLASVVVSYDNATNTVSFDAADTQWNPITVTGARRAVLYKATGSDATSPLIEWIDFGEDKSLTAGILKFVWAANGIGAVVAA